MFTLGSTHSLTGIHKQTDERKHSPLHSTMLTQPHSPLTPLQSAQNNGFIYWEEISTIFVIGFPDDIQEREFQNMFIFSPGFEAAALKIPSKNDELETTALATYYNKKQTIGFAKFKTRPEALAAKDTMNGRTVDTEKGYVLKAEMAKKNLHRKRESSSCNKTLSLDQHSSWVLFPQHQQHEQQQQNYHHHHHHDLTSILQSPTFPMEAPYQQSSSSSSSLGTIVKRSTNPDHSCSSVYAAFHSVPFADRTPIYSDLPVSHSTANSAPTQSIVTKNTSTIPNSTPHITLASESASSANASSVYTKPPYLLEKATSSSASRPTFTASSSPVLKARHRQYEHPHHLYAHSSSSSSNSFFNYDQQKNQPRYSALHGLTINTSIPFNSGGSSSTMPPEPVLSSPANFPMMPNTNPADQNPPCNTLYVGNLPPNTDEGELRRLFQQCSGYKRLSFRQKPNGPMCFVEFDDIPCATQVLQDLYGSPLSNSVKGGIRLSFSKNPLGVRRNSCCHGGCNTKNDQLFFQSAATVVPCYRDILSFGSP